MKGMKPALARRIPGLKSETPRHAGAGWGTLPLVRRGLCHERVLRVKVVGLPGDISKIPGLKI
jgi:hypothetical protein